MTKASTNRVRARQSKVAAKPAAAQEADDFAFVDEAASQTAVPLKAPFVWRGERYDSITVRKLDTGALLDFGMSAEGEGDRDDLEIFAAMTGLPLSVFRRIDGVDGMAVMAACTTFLPQEALERLMALAPGGVSAP